MVSPHRTGFLALLVSIFCGTAVSSAQSLPPDDAVREILTRRITEGRAVGLVVGLLEPDGSTRVIVAGSAGPDAPPLSEHTLFEIGSITKVFTGALLAEMDRRGEVGLDDPVSRHLPPGVRVPAGGDREITLLDLATHRSALPRLPTNLAPQNERDPYADYTAEKLYAFLGSYQLPREIGAAAEYSNLGAGLLAHALGRAAGGSYAEALRERILDPLDLDDTVISLSNEQRSRLAHGHDARGAVVPHWNFDSLAGAGALRSSASDLLRWLDANIGEPETDLERALRAAQEPRNTLGDGVGVPAIGLHWIVQPRGDSRTIWHNGGTGGFFSFAGFDPQRRVGVVVLSNAQHSVDDIGFHLLDPSHPLTLPPAQRTEIDLDPEILRQYVGVYQLAPEFALTISEEDGSLFLQATGQSRVEAFAESEDEFFLRVVDAQIVFQRDADGVVTGLILHQNGQSLPAARLP